MGPGGLVGARLPDLGEELGEVVVGGLEELPASKLPSDRLLEERGGRQTTVLDRLVEIVGKIHLHPWHTPDYTHTSPGLSPPQSHTTTGNFLPMADNVVVDGLEPGRIGPSAGGWWVPVAGLVIAALFFIASGGGNPVVPAPDPVLPELEPAVESWVPLRLPGAGSLTAVTDYSGGLLAAGSGPQFWRSPDGAAWELGAVTGGEGAAAVGGDSVTGLAGIGEGAVAVGIGAGDGTQTTAAAWVSEDGGTWERIELAIAAERSGLDGVVSSGGTVVAWGWTGTPRDFDPEVDNLVLVSVADGMWRDASIPADGVRLHSVLADGEGWLATGGVDGRPALWSSADLATWERIPTEGLPFGWTMVDAVRGSEDVLTVNLMLTGTTRTQTWTLETEAEWRLEGASVDDGPTDLTTTGDGVVGVGEGRLWRLGEEWSSTAIVGTVEAVSGGVAVGGLDGQPALWVEQPTAPPTAEVDQVGEGSWVMAAELGEGDLKGAWPVADGTVVGVGDRAWFVNGVGAVEPIVDLDGVKVDRVDRAWGEWVAVPEMLWSDDGTTWVLRGDPWDGFIDGRATVAGVSVTEGGAILAVGFTDRGLWAAAESYNGGRTWRLVGDPLPATPVFDILPIPGGFIGEAAGARTTRQVVVSTDGVTWEPFLGGRLVKGVDVAAVVTMVGELHLLAADERVLIRRFDITALAHRPGEDHPIAFVAGGRLWLRDDPWSDLPLDPPHGMDATDIHPITGLEGPAVVGSEAGLVDLYRWNGSG